MLTRNYFERMEVQKLAPYALKSSQSKGRVYKEAEHPYRTAFARDRDRIIHSTAFRRLEYKTQVFVNHEGDHYRTRLTHSLEAAQISRTISEQLRLNTDLVETITLAHDLGHTPFGHAGEDELSDLMKDYGGFDHNLQSLRIVDYLEERYPGFRGLNLTYESRTGLFKHPHLLKEAQNKGMGSFDPRPSPSLESQVVDIADEIAYDNHDIDDGLASGLIKESQLSRLALWQRASKQVKKRLNVSKSVKKYQVIRFLINAEVTDLVKTSTKNLAKLGIKSPRQAQDQERFVIGFSSQMNQEREQLRDFLRKYLYKHFRVVRMTDKARRFIHNLFQAYMDRPELLPAGFQKRFAADGVHRVVCDYIAGMTDRYAQNECKKLFEPFEKV